MQNRNIRKIKESFYSKGFNFNLIERDGNFAIFSKVLRQSFSKQPNIHYEVIKIAIGKPNPMFDKNPEYDFIEIYPSSESWGTNGFTCFTLERAKEKLEELKNKNIPEIPKLVNN